MASVDVRYQMPLVWTSVQYLAYVYVKKWNKNNKITHSTPKYIDDCERAPVGD